MTLILSGTNGVSDIDGDASTPALRGTDANSGVFFGSDVVGVSTGGTERLRIDASGNVFSGTISAFSSDTDKPKFGVASSDASFDSLSTDADEACFENNGNAGVTIVSAASSTANIYFGRPSFGSIGRIVYNHTDEALIFGTNNTAERMRINSIGQISVLGSTASFDTTGDVNGLQLYYETDSGIATIGTYSNGGATDLTFHTNNSGASAERMRIDYNGNLLVGTTSVLSPDCVFQVSGSAAAATSVIKVGANGNGAFIFRNAANNTVGSIAVNASSTVYNTSSDYRLKENVAPMTGALTKVLELKPCTYTWKIDGSVGEGFIAHELQEVAPYAVTGEKDGKDMQGVDYGKITPLLTAALQEAIAEIQSLKARVAELEAK